MNSFFHVGRFAGERLNFNSIENNNLTIHHELQEKKYYDFFRTYRWSVFLWLRELLWLIGRWRSPELRKFIHDYKPTVIYAESSDSLYMYNLLKYVRVVSKVPVVLFHADDLVTFRQFSISPFYWIQRIIQRIKIKQAILNAEINYCIIDEQRDIYSKIFGSNFKLLYKCGDFSFLPEVKKEYRNGPIQIVYVGNIYYSRWKTLAAVAQAINDLDDRNGKFVLKIYTANNPTQRIRNALSHTECVRLMGKIPYSDVPNVLKNSDILLHVESFNLKEKLITSLSFSTKIVDYFTAAKCTIAIGWSKAASIKYLVKNDAAIVITKLSDIKPTFNKIQANPSIIESYALKGYECGKRNHDKSIILKAFRDDLIRLSSHHY